MDLFTELTAIIDKLNAEEINYALCGGMAMAIHGYPRFTADIDIIILLKDIALVKEALKSIDFTFAAGPFPFDVHGPHPREIYRISKIIGEEIVTLDLLIVNKPLETVWNSKEVFLMEGREFSVVSREGLILMKRIAGREQDLLDIKKLEELHDE